LISGLFQVFEISNCISISYDDTIECFGLTFDDGFGFIDYFFILIFDTVNYQQYLLAWILGHVVNL